MVEAILEDQSQVAAREIYTTYKIHAGPKDGPGGITADPHPGVLEQLQGAAGEASVDAVRVGRIVGRDLEARQDARAVKDRLAHIAQDDGLRLGLRCGDGIGTLATHDHRHASAHRQYIRGAVRRSRGLYLTQGIAASLEGDLGDMDVLLSVPGSLHLGEHDLVMPVGHRIVEGHRARHAAAIAQVRGRRGDLRPSAVPIRALFRLGPVDREGLRIPRPDVVVGASGQSERRHRIDRRRRLEDETAARTIEIEVLGVGTAIRREYHDLVARRRARAGDDRLRSQHAIDHHQSLSLESQMHLGDPDDRVAGRAADSRRVIDGLNPHRGREHDGVATECLGVAEGDRLGLTRAAIEARLTRSHQLPDAGIAIAGQLVGSIDLIRGRDALPIARP